mgnify:CR=1 FL=1
MNVGDVPAGSTVDPTEAVVRSAKQLRGWLRRKSEIGLRAVGLLSDEHIEKTEDGIPVLGTSDDIENVVREQGITQVILLEFPLFTEVNRNLIRACDQLGVRHELMKRWGTA